MDDDAAGDVEIVTAIGHDDDCGVCQETLSTAVMHKTAACDHEVLFPSNQNVGHGVKLTDVYLLPHCRHDVHHDPWAHLVLVGLLEPAEMMAVDFLERWYSDCPKKMAVAAD
jgi:hypothetical protein